MGDQGMEYDMANGGGDDLGPNRAFPPRNAKLGSKIGSTRNAGRGASTDLCGDGGGERPNNASYSFFGAPDGSNTDTFHKPEVKRPTNPTLGD